MAEFNQPSGESLAILVPDTATGRLRSKAVAATPVIGPELLTQRAELLLADPESPFPPGTRLLALYELDGGQLVLDLSPEIRQLKGSAGEQWAVASLVDTLAIDRPRLQGVRILVDGQPAESMGHLDLTEPFAPVLSLLPEKGAKKP
jgi:spore germination protein GerM